jgi:hypothetical protein
MFIEEGTTLADTAWVLTTNDSITVGGAAGTAMTFTQFAGAGVGISAISIATVNGLQGSSSGGNSPVITLSTTLLVLLRVTELERLYRKQLLLVGRKFLEPCSREWWYRSQLLVVYLEVIMLSVISLLQILLLL